MSISVKICPHYIRELFLSYNLNSDLKKWGQIPDFKCYVWSSVKNKIRYSLAFNPKFTTSNQIIRANTNQSFYSHIRFPYRKILKINVVPESKLSSD